MQPQDAIDLGREALWMTLLIGTRCWQWDC